MKSRLKNLLIILICLGLFGCAPKEAPTFKKPKDIKKLIVSGKTTQKEILDMFGKPDLINKRDKILPDDFPIKIDIPAVLEPREIWQYTRLNQRVDVQ